MHRLSVYTGLLSLMAVCLASCEIINPKEELPAYISFQDPQTSTLGDTTFRSTTGIRNVWLYHAGFLQGAYQLDPDADTAGRVVPILELDRSDFFVEGGVYESGQSAYQIPYPFWDRVTFDWEAGVGETLVVKPVFHYVDESLYDLPVSESFEGGGIAFNDFSLGFDSEATHVETRHDDVFRGTGSGYVEFGAGKRYFEVRNTIPFRTVQSSNIFAEVTYKNTIPFTVGLLYGSVTSPATQAILSVSPSTEWNTVYVHMITEVRSILNLNGTDTEFWLWIRADGENNDGYIRFDDIRVIKEK